MADIQNEKSSTSSDNEPTNILKSDFPSGTEPGTGTAAARNKKDRSTSLPVNPYSTRSDGRIVLDEHDNMEHTAFAFPTWKKWTILSVIFVVQVSMNFNTSIYPNAVDALTEEFHVTGQVARLGQMIFLVMYAFGSELWAPWSEDLGRWPILQLSLFLVNIWSIPCALAPNIGTMIVCRGLGGLSSAGGSVTLGMVADMWGPDDQQYAIAYIVLSSVGGTTVGPFIGGFVQRHLSWHWVFWIQLIFGGTVQAMHFFVPETRNTILMDRLAKRRRKAGEGNVWGPNEVKENRFSAKEILKTWIRPFEMFVREPIVLSLSLLSGFSDALIFTFLESYKPVYEQWHFGTTALGLAFLPIIIGYFIGYFSFFPFIHRQRQIRRKDPDALQPEARLYWLLFTAPLETIGLFGFAWSSLGPNHGVHWIAPMIFSVLIAIANVSFVPPFPTQFSRSIPLSSFSTSIASSTLKPLTDHPPLLVRHLHGNNRLHGSLLRSLQRQRNRWQRPSARLPRRHRRPLRHSLLWVLRHLPARISEHDSRVHGHCCDYPDIHLLLEGAVG